MRSHYAATELDRLPWPWPLTGWYANPVPAAVARRRLHARRPGTSAAAQLQAQILAFWAEGPGRLHLEPLKATVDGEAGALLQLVEGQLRMSVRLSDAMRLLDAGFHRAAPFLAPRDYFLVLRRHELLRRLPLHGKPARPADLDSLLVEARLRGRPDRSPDSRPDDTLG